MQRTRRSTVRVVLLITALVPTSFVRAEEAKNASAAAAPCIECIRIRLGLPRVVRGPAIDIADNHFCEIRLPDGRFRGFDAHGETRAIDGNRPWDMGGPARTVLRQGEPNTYYSCGQWLNHVEPVGSTILGFIHNETACRYQLGQTHESMSLATSSDYGLTWKSLGQIITGTDAPAANKTTGEGDCTAANGQDGYYYAYCRRNRDGAATAARAPVADTGPGKWMKFFHRNQYTHSVGELIFGWYIKPDETAIT